MKCLKRLRIFWFLAVFRRYLALATGQEQIIFINLKNYIVCMGNKTKAKKEVHQYIKEYILSEEATQIMNSSDTFNEEGFDIWSFKKLILLEYYLKPYLTILQSRGYTCYFIDLFSGCGANKVSGEKVTSIGSSILSLLRGIVPIKSKSINYHFKKWFFVDYNPTFCQSLRRRAMKTLEILNKKYGENLVIDENVKILEGDCNEKINEIILEIEKESNGHKIAVLAFIDPYTFTNINWKTWKTLLKLRYVDIIFTFPINTLKRGLSQCKEMEKYLPPSLIELVKVRDITKIEDEEFSKRYAAEIAGIVNRPINYSEKGISVKNSKNSELYRIWLFTYSDPAANLTSNLVKELDRIDPSSLKMMFEKAKGKQKSILDEYS